MSIVVLGAGGLLGRHVVAELGGDVRAFARSECDITNPAQVHACVDGARLVVNCAGFTNVDGAEKDQAGANRVNVDGTRNLTLAAKAVGAKLVHVSTDFVFDGAQPEPYDEAATPNPQSAYARSKWQGELVAKASTERLFIVRVQGLYGRGGANFSSKLLQLLRDGKPLKLDGERRVQPTWARVAARRIVELGKGEAFGTYHVSCAGETTWAGFAARLAERIGVAANWQVVRSDALDAPAKRPPNCLFAHRGLERLGLGVPTWQEAQDEYLAEETAR